MHLTFEQIKELIAYGQELGLQQLQTEGLVIVYGGAQRTILQPQKPDDDDVRSITEMYAALGRDKLGR